MDGEKTYPYYSIHLWLIRIGVLGVLKLLMDLSKCLASHAEVPILFTIKFELDGKERCKRLNFLVEILLRTC